MKIRFFHGFTLVELLVVISIISLLAGLLLPAVNAAREAGRRTTCINNESQLAVAFLGYDSARGHIPPIRAKVGEKSVEDEN
ncbi:MAG: type II secretion system GspH family protein, partial [Planctomycetaceae bacterium]|nr:type II secretion system GspH family protein [Planctomycetaceae bacterium]